MIELYGRVRTAEDWRKTLPGKTCDRSTDLKGSAGCVLPCVKKDHRKRGLLVQRLQSVHDLSENS